MNEDKELTAICPSCDNIIEIDENLQVGDFVSCTNYPCFWDGIVEDIDSDGNVWFEEHDDE